MSQIRSLGNRCISWLQSCFGASAQVDDIAQKQFNRRKAEPYVVPTDQLSEVRRSDSQQGEKVKSVGMDHLGAPVKVQLLETEEELDSLGFLEDMPLFNFTRSQAEVYAKQFPLHVIFRSSTRNGIATSIWVPQKNQYVNSLFEPLPSDPDRFLLVGSTHTFTVNEIVPYLESIHYKIFRSEHLEAFRSLETWSVVYRNIENREQAEELLNRTPGPAWLLRTSSKGYVLSAKIEVPVYKNGVETGRFEEVFQHQVLDPTKTFPDTLIGMYGFNTLLFEGKGFPPNRAVQPANVALAQNAYMSFNPAAAKVSPPSSYGALPIRQVESIFQRVPVGSWMLREDEAGDAIVTLKGIGGLLEHLPVGTKSLDDLTVRYGAKGLLKKEKPLETPEVYGVMDQENGERVLDQAAYGNWLIAISPETYQPYVLQKTGDEEFKITPLTSFDLKEIFKRFPLADLVTVTTPAKVQNENRAPGVEVDTGYFIKVSKVSFGRKIDVNEVKARFVEFYGAEKIKAVEGGFIVHSSQNELIASGLVSRRLFQGWFGDLEIGGRQPRPLGVELTTLLDDGKTHFRQLYPKRVDIQVPPHATDHQLLETVFAQHQLLVIGETHDDPAPKEFLIDNFAKLKALGVTTFFLEHLNYDTIQGDLDTYFRSPPGSPMSKSLSSYLKYLDNGFKRDGLNPSFYRVVEEAKKQGIRIVAIDTEASYAAGYSNFGGSGGADRMIGMNYQAKLIVEKELRPDEKGVFLVGSSHISTCDGIPGLTEIFGAPNIVVGQGNLRQLETQAKEYRATEGFQGRVNLRLTRPVKGGK